LGLWQTPGGLRRATEKAIYGAQDHAKIGTQKQGKRNMEFTMNPDGSLKPDGENNPANQDAAPGAKALPVTPPQPGDLTTAPGDVMKDSDTANFMADVIEASKQVPVIVYFWAEWCGPCKQFGPALKKVVTQAAGLVKVVKINVDENQELAGQMRIQSIPAVYAFKDGQPTDGFTGALPESQIKTFIDKQTGGAKPPLEAALDDAQAALDAGDVTAAGAIFGKIQAQDPANEKALAGMIRVALAAGEHDQAKEMIDSLPPELTAKPDIAAAIAAVELSRQGQDTGEADEYRSRLEKNENDHQARFDLAMAFYGSNQTEAAIDELLDLFSRAPKWDDEAARKQLLKIFDALGAADPLAASGRKRLSSLLFS